MKNTYNITLLFSILLLAACASLQTPEGGPRDTTAPEVLQEKPRNLTTNFKEDNIQITFDEYFKLNSEFTEISISPAQEIPPLFKIKQKSLIIDFKDSLETNTTYTINFGKAIQDVNESNTLKNYSYVFATGPELDSLQIKGKVISALDNKEVKDVTVFILPISRDSIFGKKKPSIYTITDSAGNFSLKNLREDTYRIYALQETGSDRIYNSPNEEIAFLKDSINLNKDTSEIVLKLFKEIPEVFRTTEQKLENDGKISLIFNKPISKPSLTFLGNNEIKNPIIDFSSKGDTVGLWLREITFDSLKVVINSDKTPLDTITFRRGSKDEYKRTILFNNNLSDGKIAPLNPLTLTFNLPIAKIDESKISLYVDSTKLNGLQIKKLPPSERKYQLQYNWQLKKAYNLVLEDGAVTDIYGNTNKSLKLAFELDDVEDYGTLSLKVSKADSSKNYIIQLTTEKGDIYKERRITQNTTLEFNYIPTGKYFIKVIEDMNNNGIYDTGNLRLKLQPEKIYVFDKEILTRANWDREEAIEIPKVF
ncbi:Ig-like domain-containing domain [Pedobacter alpinus]|uniref:Ig-like domain-containing domain n=1 Tax=Pedobacter alpinus TaxID=1590643 RepID=A0ABW5TWV3_9SPHI